MNAFWLRYRLYAIGLGALSIGFLMYIAHVRATAVWRERAHVADSTAKVTQRDRARVERVALGAIIRSDSIERSFARLRTVADSLARIAQDATRDAETAKASRRSAIAALARSQTGSDSLRALVVKSLADDSVIASLESGLGSREQEAASLRQAVDDGAASRRLLVIALDSARAQLRRDGQVIESLQRVIDAARPTTGPRLTKLSLAAGIGYCAAPDLTPRLCGAVVAGPTVRFF